MHHRHSCHQCNPLSLMLQLPAASIFPVPLQVLPLLVCSPPPPLLSQLAFWHNIVVRVTTAVSATASTTNFGCCCCHCYRSKCLNLCMLIRQNINLYVSNVMFLGRMQSTSQQRWLVKQILVCNKSRLFSYQFLCPTLHERRNYPELPKLS